MEVEEKRESAPEEAMEEEEWAPGQVVWKVGGQDGPGRFLFPLFGCVLLFVFLLARRRPTMTGQAGQGRGKRVYKQLPPMLRHRRSRCHSLLGCIQRDIK